jgi:hypothetical protein
MAARPPDKVRKAIEKRARRQVRALLDAETGPTETQIGYAAQLLEGRDPAAVVATLLRFAIPALPREPMPVNAIDPEEERKRSRARDEARFQWRNKQGPNQRPNRSAGPGPGRFQNARSSRNSAYKKP